jgi:hypothetical protein
LESPNLGVIPVTTGRYGDDTSASVTLTKLWNMYVYIYIYGNQWSDYLLTCILEVKGINVKEGPMVLVAELTMQPRHYLEEVTS